MQKLFLDLQRRFGGRCLLASLLLAGSALAWAHEGHQKTDTGPTLKRSEVVLTAATGKLVRQDGVTVDLKKLLDNGKPVVVAFIYTSCTAVCPITSHILAETQKLLGDDFGKVQMLSVSIDPEFDTPAVLAAYSRSLGAKPQWQHYTGSLPNIVAVQKAFHVYRGDKMNHDSLIFVGNGNNKDWVRFEGFPTAEQLVKELHVHNKS